MAYIQDWGMRVQAQPQINTTRRAFLHLSQNENGRMLNIRITDVNIPSGSTAVLAGTKPDGTVYSQAGTLAGNTATFAEDVQMTAVVGTWDAKITVTNGGNCICTARITITIDPDTVAGGAIPSDSQLDGIIAECRAIADSVRKEAYGSPLTAATAAAMTDTGRVYVYTGSESGMTAGHWYYYNGTAWADGGVYNAVAVDTDTTLSIAGKAADAKEVGDQITDLKENLNAVFVTDTASGSVAHFEDGADNVPMKSVKVALEPIQSGNGDPSPDNVRPITGFDVVKVTRVGKNLIPIKAKTATTSGVTVTINDDGSLLINGTATANDGVVLNDNTQLKNYQSGTYALAVFGENTTGLSLQIMNNTAFLPSSANIVTIPDDSTRNYVRIRFANGTTFDNVVVYPMMVYGDTVPTEYEPYNGDTYTVSLSSAGTVYGGSLDVLTGILTVYPYYASYNGETLTGRWISDRDVYAVGTTPTIGAQVVNIGAEGTEYQLTPYEVKSLLGVNNIWADTGDSAVEYRADPTLYIQRLTEPDADMIADSNIVSGQYFMVGNTLYKATANIANGGQITVGTNCTRVSLSEALNEINA